MPARLPSCRRTPGMSRAAAWAWAPLLLSLLSLLSLFWAPAEAEFQTVSVLVPRQVRGLLGDNVTLPCKLQTQDHSVQVMMVTWTWQDPAGRSQSMAVFHPTQGPSYPSNPKFPEPSRLEFVAARPGEALRDATLAVRGLRTQDEANYTCHFVMFPQGGRSAPTWLRVLAKPKNHAQPQEVLLSPLSQEPVPVAHCISEGGRPPAQISWSLDEKANKSQVPGTQPGTFTVISVLTLKPTIQDNGKNVTCIVEHESFEEPSLLPVTLSVLYPPNVSISGYDNWYLGQREATLNCDFRSNPEPTGYEWNTSMGPLPSFAVAQGTRLLIRSVDESINTTFICYVTNVLGTGQAEFTVTPREPPRGPSHLGLSYKTIIIILAVIIVTVFVAAVFYCLLFRRSRRNIYRPSATSANGTVFYSTVSNNASSPQDLPTEGTR